MILLYIAKCIYFAIPMGFANMAPVLTKNYFKFLAVPVDFNKTINSKPIFGSHKTFRGIIMAVIFSLAFFYLQKFLYQFNFFHNLSLLDYNQYGVLMGFLMGLGAIMGDLIKSFFKRRVNIKPGKSWIPFDQIDFVVGGLIAVSFVYGFTLKLAVALVLIAFFSHILFNHIGYWLGLQKGKW